MLRHLVNAQLYTSGFWRCCCELFAFCICHFKRKSAVICICYCNIYRILYRIMLILIIDILFAYFICICLSCIFKTIADSIKCDLTCCIILCIWLACQCELKLLIFERISDKVLGPAYSKLCWRIIMVSECICFRKGIDTAILCKLFRASCITVCCCCKTAIIIRICDLYIHCHIFCIISDPVLNCCRLCLLDDICICLIFICWAIRYLSKREASVFFTARSGCSCYCGSILVYLESECRQVLKIYCIAFGIEYFLRPWELYVALCWICIDERCTLSRYCCRFFLWKLYCRYPCLTWWRSYCSIFSFYILGIDMTVVIICCFQTELIFRCVKLESIAICECFAALCVWLIDCIAVFLVCVLVSKR